MALIKESNNHNIGTQSAKGLSSEVKYFNDKINFHIYIIKELHKFIVEFILDFREIDAKEIKKQINELSEIFISQERAIKLEHVFQNYKHVVSSYINDVKVCSGEKEGEFKNIIKILTEGILHINNDAKDFNLNIMDHASGLEEINHLDDIKKIKDRLQVGVSKIGEAVKEKAKKDITNIKLLSARVDILECDLKKAETASMTDKLTGAYNRLAFDMHMENLINTSNAKLLPVSIIMIDIDNFKKVNDTYGHLVGDLVIIDNVKKCKKLLRDNDIVARFGGEEFVIILEGVGLKIAQIKANKICKVIAQSAIVVDSGESTSSLSYTISIGISTLREGDTELTIIDRADRALYKAKATGKNRAINENEI